MKSNDAALEKAPRRVKVTSPQKDLPATSNVSTRPRIGRQLFQSVEPARYVYSESNMEEARFDEANEYVIKNYKLEYWVGSENANRSDDE